MFNELPSPPSETLGRSFTGSLGGWGFEGSEYLREEYVKEGEGDDLGGMDKGEDINVSVWEGSGGKGERLGGVISLVLKINEILLFLYVCLFGS